jgi:hypothetical protein
MATNTLHLIGDKFRQLWFFELGVKLGVNRVLSVTSLQQERVNISSNGGLEQVWSGVYEECRTSVDTVETLKVSTPVRNQTQFLIVWNIALSEFNHTEYFQHEII